MHGVPADMDLSSLVGATLIQIAIGEFQIQFHFHPAHCLSVEGKWELHDSAGTLIDDAAENSIVQREAVYVHVLLGKIVVSYTISAPDSLSLRLSSGHLLTVFDDSKQYESFSIAGYYI
jgi:hypothetical protein